MREASGGGEVKARGAAITLACALACAGLLAGCGQARQTAGEPSGSFPIQIAQASFPAKQAISQATTLRIAVRNRGARPLPDVAVTVDSLSYRATSPKDLADPQRPNWIVNTGPGPVAHPPVETAEVSPPGGGQTAFVHTWALGRLAPGATRVFRWRLTPVRSGVHTIHYVVAAGLNGNARAILAGGRTPAGSLTAHVAPKPQITHVDPSNGAVVSGPAPHASGPVGALP